MKKFLVTGAAGFIGSHVSQKLLDRGDQVIGVDNFNDYYDPRRKRINASSLQTYPRFHLVEADIREEQRLTSLFSEHRFDAVIHLAAMAGVRNSISEPANYFDVNFGGTKVLLELCRLHSVAQLVLASTSSAYGNSKEIPFKETDPCMSPLQPYSTSKRAAEMMAETYHRHYGINVNVLRFFTVYGPAGRPDMMPFLLADSIFSGREIPLYKGDFQRDWTYVDDIANGVVAASEKPLGYEIFNLGRGAPESLANFIATMESFAGKKANLIEKPAPSSEMLITFADNSKARRLLGFNPEVTMERGVARFWDWFVQNAKVAAKAA